MATPESTWRDRLWPALAVLAGVVATLGTLAVTVAGFSLSFDASKAVAIAAHIRKEWAWLLPVSVDGAMAVAAVVAVVMRHLKKGDVAWYPWVVVALGALISVACNALHAVGAQGQTLVLEDPRVRAAVSAIPAIMLALSVHLLVLLIELVGEVLGKGATRGTASENDEVDDANGDKKPSEKKPAKSTSGGGGGRRQSAKEREVAALAAELAGGAKYNVPQLRLKHGWSEGTARRRLGAAEKLAAGLADANTEREAMA